MRLTLRSVRCIIELLWETRNVSCWGVGGSLSLNFAFSIMRQEGMPLTGVIGHLNCAMCTMSLCFATWHLRKYRYLFKNKYICSSAPPSCHACVHSVAMCGWLLSFPPTQQSLVPKFTLLLSVYILIFEIWTFYLLNWSYLLYGISRMYNVDTLSLHPNISDLNIFIYLIGPHY